MLELSLHILDLVENAIRAGASIVSVAISADPNQNRMEISVEDNGPGFTMPPHIVTDPFYTTKEGHKTGLGISLFRAAAERAGGQMHIGRSSLGGAKVHANMVLDHIDRSPLGDFPSTISSIVLSHPEIDINCRVSVGERREVIGVSEMKRHLPVHEQQSIRMARHMHNRIADALLELKVLS